MSEHQQQTVVQQAKAPPMGQAGLQSQSLALSPAGMNIIQLQRLFGNRGVQTMLNEGRLSPNGVRGQYNINRKTSQNLIQRDDPEEERASQAENIRTLNTLKDNADRRYGLTNDYATKCANVATSMKNKLVPVSNRYMEAYERVRAVLDEAEQEAQNQQMWTNTIAGVTVGVAVGLLAAWAAPVTATAAAWTITAGEAATAAGSALGQAVTGAALTAGVGEALAVEGQSIDSSELDPSFTRLALWQQISSIYENGHGYNGASRALHNATVNITELVGEVRLYDEGADSDLTDSTIESTVATLNAKDGDMAPLETELQDKINELDTLKSVIDGIDTSSYTVNQMERDIWTMWMGSLSINSNIIDIDAIEDHLGPEGLQMVNFGSYTSDADENAAIRAARVRATALHDQYNDLFDPETVAEARRLAEQSGGEPVCIDPNMPVDDSDSTGTVPNSSEYEPEPANGVCYDPSVVPDGGFRDMTSSDDNATYYNPNAQSSVEDSPSADDEIYGPPLPDDYVPPSETQDDEYGYTSMDDEPNESVYEPEEMYSY